MDSSGDDKGNGGGNSPNADMHLSPQAQNFIKSYESYSSTVYDASGSAHRGDWTIGWGHKVLPDEDWSNGITQEEAESLFLHDIVTKAEDLIKKYVQVSLSQQQFDALGSYVYNVGAMNSLVGTKLIKELNSGNYNDAVKQMDIVTQSGVIMTGLVTRRKNEQIIWREDKYNLPQ